MTKFGYRWQSSATGAWVERDTLDVPLDPTNANRYAFVGCDPINGSDPSGRSACVDNGNVEKTLGGVAGVLGLFGLVLGETIVAPVIEEPAAAVVGGVAGVFALESVVDRSLGL